MFGITGDLARKITIPALAELERRGELNGPIIGVASRPEADLSWIVREALRVRSSDLDVRSRDIDEVVVERLIGRLRYVGGDAADPSVYKRLGLELSSRRPLFYLATLPSLFTVITERLHAEGLLTDARVALEKPFGTDSDSARELANRLHEILPTDRILLVDHFLGKEPVIEIEYLRFANAAMARLWNRETVEAIQITMAEDFGVEERGRFYDSVGALRDVVQNHLLQVLALVTMDAPVGASADDLRDKKAEVLRAISPVEPEHAVRGQYDDYRRIDGVDPHSDIETYVALRLDIDSWRWSGVPIFVRAGKRMPVQVTEVRLILRDTPRLRFLPDVDRVDANRIVLRISPDPALQMQLAGLDRSGAWKPIRLATTFERELGRPPSAYERLLKDALHGQDRLFVRRDAVEQSWRILEPILRYPPPLQRYGPGTWGPDIANDLVWGYPAWQHPWTST